MKTPGNAIEGCVRGRPDDHLGKRSRYPAWTVSVGADVCPFYYAARSALRIEQQLVANGEGMGHIWAATRDPLEWIPKGGKRVQKYYKEFML